VVVIVVPEVAEVTTLEVCEVTEVTELDVVEVPVVIEEDEVVVPGGVQNRITLGPPGAVHPTFATSFSEQCAHNASEQLYVLRVVSVQAL